MQQRLRSGIKVACLAPENKIRDEAGARNDVLANRFEFTREKNCPSDGTSGKQHHAERGENATDAARVELGVAERSASVRPENNSRDQVTGDDEKHIDSKVATANAEISMEENNSQHRDSSQAIDFWAVAKFLDQ
mgnify:CR=1 FL=1